MKLSLVALGTMALVMAWTTTASAYCRTMTCKPKKEECEIDEDGCVTSGVPQRWEKLPIIFRFHERGSTQLVPEETRAAVRAAFHRWSDVRCPEGGRTSLRFQEGEDIVEDKPLDAEARGAQPFGIYFRDLGWPYVDQDETLAKANTVFFKKSGKIEYADIEVNTTKRFALTESAEATDLQAVMTHEVGHYIGIAHSKEPLSIMAESYCSTDDRCSKGKVAARRLGEDDIEAVCAIYPPAGFEPETTTGGSEQKSDDAAKKGCATSPVHRGAGGLSLAGLGLAVTLAFRRRARRARDR